MRHRIITATLALMIAGTMTSGSALGATDAEMRPLVEGPALTEALARGGYVIYMRHTKTNRRQKDTDHLGDLADCTKQRNLSEEGREQAAVIGKSFKKLRIEVGKVYTSPYCRAVDTAELAFGGAKKTNNLRYLTYLPPEKATTATGWLRQQLEISPKRGTNTILISHTANLKEGLGLWPGNAGDIFVFRPKRDGGYVYIGRVTPDEWPVLAGFKRQLSGVN